MTASATNSLGWREAILQHFTAEIARVAPITVVLDPDQLFAEQRLLAAMHDRGFDVVALEDPVAFRFAYESRFRTALVAPTALRLVVICPGTSDVVPFDVLSIAQQSSRVLSFGLGELFPRLAPNVVTALDRDDLDALYAALHVHQPESLGENASKDFILRHVYEVAPELIKTPADLLRVLLRRHYLAKRYALSLNDRFVALVRRSGSFAGWPLESIVPDRAAFLEFVQQRWVRHVHQAAGDAESGQVPDVPEPKDLPFEHPDVRVYIDNFFTEGVLKPVREVPKSAVAESWLAVGVVGDEQAEAADRSSKLAQRLAAQVPGPDASHTEWASFAYRWGEWNLLRHRLSSEQAEERGGDFRLLQRQVDAAFATWMAANYGALASLSFLPRPVMVHQIPRMMAHSLASGGGPKRVALVVVDGLAVDQWLIVRESLGTGLQVHEDSVFGWVPTLTPVSRQAIFAGEPPFYFGGSLSTTANEEQHWMRFWENHGLRRGKASFIKQRSSEDTAVFTSRILQHLQDASTEALGVVIGVIDDALHGSAMGMGGLHAQIRYWSESGCLRNLLDGLTAKGFEVHVTADHGNCEAVGMGKPNVGSVPEQRGERVHVLPDEAIRQRIQAAFPDTISWPSLGLPNDYLPLIAGGRSAFISAGERTICHGGLSLEEVVVPYVRVLRKS